MRKEDSFATALNSGEPLWRQAEQTLLEAIKSGRFPIGSRLPSELELASMLGLHRHTVRRTIELLVGRGALEIRRGRGTYVVEAPVAYRIGPRSRFTENIRASGRTPSTRILSAQTGTATGDAARWLELSEGAPISVVTLVRAADDVPIVVARHSVPAERFPGFSDRLKTTGSVTRTYATYGVVGYTRRVTKMSARLPSQDEVVALHVGRNAPLLSWTSVNADADSRPVNLDESVFAASRVDILLDYQ
jgi:GntR family transcriptional regulator, phosphonate transport system regulatory protein